MWHNLQNNSDTSENVFMKLIILGNVADDDFCIYSKNGFFLHSSNHPMKTHH